MSGTRRSVVDSADVDVSNRVATLCEHKTRDQTDRPRFIYLPPTAADLLAKLATERPAGSLLVNASGTRWTKTAVADAVRRTRRRAGLPDPAVAYSYRHTFATKALINGVPDVTVAALLGHGSTKMIHTHYSHVSSQARAMKAALETVFRRPKERPKASRR